MLQLKNKPKSSDPKPLKMILNGTIMSKMVDNAVILQFIFSKIQLYYDTVIK